MSKWNSSISTLLLSNMSDLVMMVGKIPVPYVFLWLDFLSHLPSGLNKSYMAADLVGFSCSYLFQ